jgi:transposase
VPKTSPFTISLSPDEAQELERLARRYTAPYRDVIRAKIVLLAAQGMRNDHIAARLDLPTQIVYKWRKRFFEERLAGLKERPRRSPPNDSPR